MLPGAYGKATWRDTHYGVRSDPICGPAKFWVSGRGSCCLLGHFLMGSLEGSDTY
jgi:hypothetical protein